MAKKQLKKWSINAAVHGSKHLGVVEAATMEEAIAKGWELDTAYSSMCHQCGNECQDPEIADVTADEIN